MAFRNFIKQSIDFSWERELTTGIIKQQLEQFPYQNKRCYVFTRSDMENNEDVIFVNEDVTEFTNKLKQEDGKIYGSSVEENCCILLSRKN